jgi:hypothetical protein
MTNVLKRPWKKENNKDIFRMKGIKFLFLLFSTSLMAQTEKNIGHQSILWTRYYNQLTIHKWAIHTEFDNRLFLNPVTQNLFVARIQGRYKFSDQVEVGSGFAYFSVAIQNPELSSAFNKPEYRGQQDLTLKQDFGKIVLNHRFQVEERFFQNFDNQGLTQGTKFFWRFRYRIQGDYTFWKKEKRYLKTVVFDEIMINSGKNVAKNTFDQNRIYAGLQFGFSPVIAAEIGYMKSFQKLASGIDYYDRNIIRVSIFHKLKL